MTTFEAIKLMNKEQLAYVLSGVVNSVLYVCAGEMLGMSDETVRKITGESMYGDMAERCKDIFMNVLDSPVDVEVERMLAADKSSDGGGAYGHN